MPVRTRASKRAASAGATARRARPARPGSVASLRLHWSEANRFPGAVWPASHLVVGALLPFALLLRYAGFPGAWLPVWLPLLDPLVHAGAGLALLVWFCRREQIDAWHLGLDRARIDGAAGWTLALLPLLLLGGAWALRDPAWVEVAPGWFEPARLLLRAARYEPGTGTRWVAGLFISARAGLVGPAQEILLTGLLYPQLRRRAGVLPSALACAALTALFDARAVECDLEPCLRPALEAAALQAGGGLVSALAYERLRSLWIPILWQAGWELARAAPGLGAALFC